MKKIQLVIKSINRQSLVGAAKSAIREGFKPLVSYDGEELPDTTIMLMREGLEHIDFVGMPRSWGSYGFMAANNAVANSNAEYIMFLDDDDELIEGAGDIIRDYLDKNSPDILIPGLRFTQEVQVNFGGTIVTGTDLCIDSRYGIRPGNVAMAIYKTSIFRDSPFREYPNPDYSDFQHIAECLGKGYKVDFLGEVLYLVRPHEEGTNGRGQ